MIHEGETLGDYEVQKALRSGGMASLYLGRRRGPAGFARHVAIKVVHTRFAKDRAFIDMFLDEARLSARIHHPNVVHVEQLGEADGHYYLVMEYVHGAALSQLLAALSRSKRALSPELAVWIAIQVADGLHAAHETRDEQGKPLGVVHRDVSPQNVLLAYGGHVKLIDFGIAKAAGRLRATEAAGAIKGKARYMAPEQALGREVDRRADVWALGVVLWEMLAMRRLFTGESDVDVLRRVRAPEAMLPPSVHNPLVSPDLDRAVMRALSVSLDDRTATADDFRCELADALPGSLAKRASDLSRVLFGVLSDAIERERTALPESMSRLELEAPTDVHCAAAVDEHTMILDTVEYLTDDAVPPVPVPSADVAAARTLPRRHVRRALVALAAAALLAAPVAYLLATGPPDAETPAPPAPTASSGSGPEEARAVASGPGAAAPDPVVAHDAGVSRPVEAPDDPDEPSAHEPRAVHRTGSKAPMRGRVPMREDDVDRVGGMPFVDDLTF